MDHADGVRQAATTVQQQNTRWHVLDSFTCRGRHELRDWPSTEQTSEIGADVRRRRVGAVHSSPSPAESCGRQTPTAA